MTTEQFLLTLVASAVGAFVAAWLSLRFAIPRLRSERAFDRRLLWYEKATSLLITAGNRVNWALAAEVSGRPASALQHTWTEAHQALIDLRGLEIEAELYASNAAYEATRTAVQDVSALGHIAFATNNLPNSAEHVRKVYEILGKLLFHAASRLAGDVRNHLDLEPLAREWRLYDEEMRQLHEELQHKASLQPPMGSVGIRSGV